MYKHARAHALSLNGFIKSFVSRQRERNDLFYIADSIYS